MGKKEIKKKKNMVVYMKQTECHLTIKCIFKCSTETLFITDEFLLSPPSFIFFSLLFRMIMKSNVLCITNHMIKAFQCWLMHVDSKMLHVQEKSLPF